MKKKPKIPKYTLKKKILNKGFPTHDPEYKTAHEEASKKEKANFPKKDYKQLEHLDESIPYGELIGKNTRRKKIYVSKKVPKKLRPEVAFHEKAENEILLKKKR